MPHDPTFWIPRAEEAPRRAQAKKDDHARRAVVTAAESYEALAQRAASSHYVQADR
jgi:hypothetical protein